MTAYQRSRDKGLDDREEDEQRHGSRAFSLKSDERADSDPA